MIFHVWKKSEILETTYGTPICTWYSMPGPRWVLWLTEREFAANFALLTAGDS